jgi:predicted dehydrogenase
MKIFQTDPRVHVAGICDVDEAHLSEGLQSAPGAKGCRHFEELIARADVDAIYMAVPDHWHGTIATAAARAGKDVYGEKPLAHNWMEGAAIRETVARYGRVWQTGSWQRSISQFRFACELVRNGRIGKVQRVELGLPAGSTDWDGTGSQSAPVPPPPGLEYERWLGPAPVAPYAPARVHKTWRWNFDYGGGSLMDWVGHHVDIAHWGLGFDHTGPLEVEATAEFASTHPIWNAPPRWRVNARYEEGVTMYISGGNDDVRSGTRWIGDGGWVWVDRSGIETNPRNLLTSKIRPDEINLPVSASHHRQFIDCVLTRSRTLTPPDVALRSATPGYLGVIAMRTGRKIRWDPQREQILNDDGAARMLGRTMRSPWHV